MQNVLPGPREPPTPLTSISSPWPFNQWGVDIVRPFPNAPGMVKYMVATVDYYTKWIEADPLACISGRQTIKFMWKNIVTRFGIPKVFVRNNGLQFAENPY